jgi:cytochrome c oxidase subunit I+III
VAAFAFFLLGGVQALLLRLQLARPDGRVLDAATYNQLFTMHGTTMMFLFVIPFIEALANYVLPLMLGTRDLPFPRLTALSFWTFVFGGLFVYASFWAGAVPDGGWFAYVPLSDAHHSPGLNMDFWDIGLSVAEVAALAAAAELAVAVLRMRAAGMSLDRMPLFAWAMLVTAFMIVFAFTPLIVGTAMLELDRKEVTRFFRVEAGGQPLLWQHLFWMFGHPEVYIMFLPAVGVVSHVVQTFARRPIASYLAMVLAILAVGFLSFGLWVHHMFTTGLPPLALSLFAIASLALAVPSGVQVATWIATVWGARPVWRPPLYFVAGFVAIFVAGGLTGVMVAVVPFNWQVHDSYFVVAHFHYVLIGGVLFPLFAGLHYWLPKITGRMLDERLARWSFWTMFVFFNVTFFPMHVAGLAGMPRRVATYPAGLGWEPWNLVSSAGAFGLAVGVLLVVANVLRSLRRGAPAGDDPWGADTLEWSQPSPPPAAQFSRLPVVRSRHPLWEQDSLEPDDPALERALAPLDHAPGRWRGALVVTPLEARPVALVHLPARSVWPFVLSVAFVLIFAGALVDHGAIAGAGGVLAAVALVGWFWPHRTERLALEEVGVTGDADRLPLAVAGPRSNGWWGTVMLLLILGVALASLLASYWYLGAAAALAPTWPARFRGPVAATVLLAGAGLLVAAAVWGRRRRTRRLAVAGSLALGVAFLWVTLADLVARAVPPWTSAAASIVWSLVGFHAMVTAVALVMLAVALVWACLAAADPRGLAPLQNGALVGAFVAASWVAVAATVYVAPLLW